MRWQNLAIRQHFHLPVWNNRYCAGCRSARCNQHCMAARKPRRREILDNAYTQVPIYRVKGLKTVPQRREKVTTASWRLVMALRW